jgi:hypothetical protein
LLHNTGLDFNGTVKYGPRNLLALGETRCAAAAPDSSWILTGHPGSVQRLAIGWTDSRQYAIVPGKPSAILTDVRRVNALALSGAANLLAVADGEAQQVRIHRLSVNGAAAGPAQLRIAADNPMACALSPDGKWIAIGSGDPLSVGVRDAGTGVPAPPLDGVVSGRNWRPVFSRDGRWLAVAGRSCQVFSVGSWNPGPALELPPNGADYHGAAFYCAPDDPERCLLAVVGGDRHVYLFRLSAGPPAKAERLAILRSPGNPFVSFPAFDDHGNLTVALPRAMLATWSLTEVQRELRALNLHW